MKTKIVITAFLAITLMFSCKKDKKEDTEVMETEAVETPAASKPTPDAKKVKVNLTSKSGSKVTGNAVFTEDNGSVKMVIVLGGLDQGTHAIHLHETADCTAEDATSSGGHWNPTGQPHGQWGDASGYHKGDIGNVVADENGHATKNFTTDEWCIGCGDATKDILGKAIIVHQGEDDFKSQPSGNAGARVSCGGVIE